MSERKKYIDGLKGMFCIWIMIGHFFNLYSYCEEPNIFSCDILNWLNSFQVTALLLYAGFWLYGFLVISGYLLSNKSVNSIVELTHVFLKRFLRLYLPMVAAGVFIFILYSIFSNDYSTCDRYFTNYWFQQNKIANITVLDIFVDPLRTLFIGKSRLNSPYWVMRDIFLASLMIYFCNMLKCKINDYCFWGIEILLLSVYFVSTTVFACFCGAILGWNINLFCKRLRKNDYVWCVILFLIVFLLKILLRDIPPLAYSIVFVMVVVLIEQVVWLKERTSNRVFVFCGDISFGIYSVHFPVLSTLGIATLDFLLQNGYAPTYSVLFVWVECIIGSFVLATVYNKTLEKIVNRILRYF